MWNGLPDPWKAARETRQSRASDKRRELIDTIESGVHWKKAEKLLGISNRTARRYRNHNADA